MLNESADFSHRLQQTSQPLEPFVESPTAGAATARYCSNCDTDVEPRGKGHCPECGRFLRENAVAVTHGGRRMSPAPERETRRSALRAAVWADLGGAVPAIIAEVVEDFIAACILRDQVAEYLEVFGALTHRGSRRAAMDLYLALGTRIERLSVLLGNFRQEAKANESQSHRISKIEHVIVYPSHEDPTADEY